jgi:hypothetical protein
MAISFLWPGRALQLILSKKDQRQTLSLFCIGQRWCRSGHPLLTTQIDWIYWMIMIYYDCEWHTCGMEIIVSWSMPHHSTWSDQMRPGRSASQDIPSFSWWNQHICGISLVVPNTRREGLIIYIYLHCMGKYVWYAVYVELYMYIDMNTNKCSFERFLFFEQFFSTLA